MSYLNDTTMKLTEKQIEEARNAAYAEAGYNAFFGTGFDAGFAQTKAYEDEFLNNTKMETHYFQINPDNNRKQWDQIEAFTDKVMHSDAQANNLARFLSALYRAEVRISKAASKELVLSVSGRYIRA